MLGEVGFGMMAGGGVGRKSFFCINFIAQFRRLTDLPLNQVLIGRGG